MINVNPIISQIDGNKQRRINISLFNKLGPSTRICKNGRASWRSIRKTLAKEVQFFFKSEEDLILENTLPEKFGKAFV